MARRAAAHHNQEVKITEIYKYNLFARYPSFFIKVRRAPISYKDQPITTMGFVIEERDGEWVCETVIFNDNTIKNMVLIADDKSIKPAIISAVLNAYRESSGYDLGSESKEGAGNE